MRTVLVVLAWVVGVLAVLGVGFLWMMRTKQWWLLRPFHRLQRDRINPIQLRRDAGQPGAYASIVHHVGRRSGTAYRTPVVTVEVDRGLVVALPYGSGTDWARNVLAAGGARIEREGQVVEVADPELLDQAEANPWFDAATQRQHRLFNVEEFLLLHPV